MFLEVKRGVTPREEEKVRLCSLRLWVGESQQTLLSSPVQRDARNLLGEGVSDLSPCIEKSLLSLKTSQLPFG